MTAPLELRQVSRSYADGGATVNVLQGASLKVERGELVALVAPSGAGKSTLLQLAGLLERPDAGEVLIGGVDAGALSDLKRTAMRRKEIGFVYQFHHLMGDFTARENVALPLRLNGLAPKAAMERADDLLSTLGLSERLTYRPAALSGGERQRVAIARAVAHRPALLLADEPTGNLDAGTANAVRNAFIQLSRDEGLAALVATHNVDFAADLDRTLTITDGHVTSAD